MSDKPFKETWADAVYARRETADLQDLAEAYGVFHDRWQNTLDQAYREKRNALMKVHVERGGTQSEFYLVNERGFGHEARVYLVTSTFEEDEPVIFKTRDLAMAYVMKNVDLHQKDEYTNVNWKETGGMGVGLQWEIIFNGQLTFWVTEKVVHEDIEDNKWTEA